MNIVDCFDRCYFKTLTYPCFLKKGRIDSLGRFLIKRVANVVLPCIFFFTKGKKSYTLTENAQSKPNRIIVTFTSFPARIGRIHLVVESILRQTCKPDMIVLWLSRKQFASLDELPKPLLAQQARGLTIKLVGEDIRSHKKYYYSLQQYPEDTLITIDDDIFYRSDMIETLLKTSERYPKSVIANYTFKITYDGNELMPYNNWQNAPLLHSYKGFDVFFGSGGGTLYPPHSLHPNVFEKEVFLNICPLADDVWLNAMCRLNGYDVVKTSYQSLLLPVLTASEALFSKNCSEGMNDVQIKKVREYSLKKLKMDPFRLND